MATYVLDAYSKAYPFIVNRIMASVYLQSDPQALIATIIDSTAGHPARVWHFPGLKRTNYGFSLDEIDGSGVKTGNNLATFSVVPGQIDGLLTRDDEQLFPDTSVGFNTGDNTFTFDGTGGKPDYVGWSIVPSELTGRGILQEGVDYSWDTTIGKLQLLQVGDIFQAPWNIHFNPQQVSAGNSEPTVIDFDILFETAARAITVTDFGKKMIIELVGSFGQFTLPDIATVPQGRKLMIEVGGSNVCCKFVVNGSDTLNFCRGNLMALSNEKFSIYKVQRANGDKEWRVDDERGNYFTCGDIISQDMVTADLFNVQAMNGAIVSTTSKYARHYTEVVLNLDATQVCNYDDWATGNNKYLYSLANSSNPANANKYHFPDRTGLYHQNNKIGKAGDYIASSVGAHTHKYNIITTDIPSGPNVAQIEANRMKNGSDRGLWVGDGTLRTTVDGTGIGATTNPESFIINQYVLI